MTSNSDDSSRSKTSSVNQTESNRPQTHEQKMLLYYFAKKIYGNTDYLRYLEGTKMGVLTFARLSLIDADV
ncbi:hypothetical protein MPER_01359 [Moniliophthora perniciosa FA553]|nr:hypothetical protein MPER_01359 [Moniliophthora perniciosa FA553]